MPTTDGTFGMVRNAASMQSLRAGVADCSLSSQTEQPANPSPSEQAHQPPIQRLSGALQLCPDDAYTKSLMTKVAMGQATAEEQAAFDKYVHQTRSLPSIQNLLQPSGDQQPAQQNTPCALRAANTTPVEHSGQGYVGELDSTQKHSGLQEHMIAPNNMEDYWRQPLPLQQQDGTTYSLSELHAQQYVEMRELQHQKELPVRQDQNDHPQGHHNQSYGISQHYSQHLPAQIIAALQDGKMQQDDHNNRQEMSPQDATNLSTIQDHQMQMMLLESQNKKQLKMTRQDHQEMSPQDATNPSAIQDHSMRLLLLEQQNKKRLRVARQGRQHLPTARSEEYSRGPSDMQDIFSVQQSILENSKSPQQMPGNQQNDQGSSPASIHQYNHQSPKPTVDIQNITSPGNNAPKACGMQFHPLEQESKKLPEEELDRRRQLLVEAEQTKMHFGTSDSTWESDRTQFLDFAPHVWQPHERFKFEQLWRSYLLQQKVQRRKSKGLAATLAANNEANKFKQATRENASQYTQPFCDFLTENPTVFHCVDALKRQLKDAGFTELSERDTWKIKPCGSYYVDRNGSSLIAFTVGANYEPGNGAAILAGHVDALTAKLKPISQVPNKAGYLQLGVAPYAGALNKTWWDRDLGIGGRVHVKDGDKIVTKLVKLDWPIARIPSLAAHFGAPAQGPFNQETQMVPIIGLEGTETSTGLFASADPFSQPPLLGGANGPVGSFVQTQPPALVKAISEQLGLHSGSGATPIVNWELELFDVQPATVGGLNKEFIFAGRIDDKLCSWAALQALLESQKNDSDSSIIKVVGLFDDEEIGSLLRQGAKGNFLPITIERAVGALANHTPTSDLVGRTYANSFMVSSDVTHAVNPNFLEVYLANHAPHLNVGIAVAADSNGHMTTDSVSTSILKRCADKIGARLQVFQIRNDSRSGGTVGPMLSSAMGVRSIDAGMAQLSMHSIRATTGALDPGLGVITFVGFLNGFESVDKEFR